MITKLNLIGMINFIDFKSQIHMRKKNSMKIVNDKNNTLNYNDNILICVLNKLSPLVNDKI